MKWENKMSNKLKRQLKTLQKSNLFCRIFVVDIEQKQLVEKYTNSDIKMNFQYKTREYIYIECIKQNKTSYQIFQENNEIWLFTFFPVLEKGKPFVIECSQNMTDKLEIDGTFIDTYAMSEKNKKISLTDELTGIYNRRHINQQLPRAIAECYERKIPLSVLFADLDLLKKINDLYGHIAGDYLLCEFALELQWCIRERADWVARYGGDEFLICLIGVGKEKAMMIAEQIRKTMEQRTFHCNEIVFKATCSLGVYTIEEYSDNFRCDIILNEIDKRLYEAKQAGRNQVR